MLSVILATKSHADAIAAIHKEAFPRQQNSEVWVSATLRAYPRIFAFVLLKEKDVVGYAFWAQKSGFRINAVVELEQVAICKTMQHKGLGSFLIKESFEQFKHLLIENGQTVKSILVSTRSDNAAQRIYSRVLGVKVAVTINDLYSADEVLMIARVS